MKREIANPIVGGWYADPEARLYEGRYWIYVTTGELNIDAFSSADLVTWEHHRHVIDMAGFPWVHKCVWAPTIIEKDGLYYLIFASNNIQSDGEIGGLEVSVSDSPGGPFRALLKEPLVGKFVNGAQPIDTHLFKDDDGKIYLYFGGWDHCNVAMMSPDMTGLVPFEDGEVFKEVTPERYVEAPCMLKKDGLYYFMWSTGFWTDGTYAVLYAVSGSPLGPFENAETLLESQPPVAEGPGHHGYLYYEPADEWLIVYHRRIIGDSAPGHRVLCIDRMNVGNGMIDGVVMT